MARDWSLAEVEATVTSYFAMLDRELRGGAYNKSEYRRQLSRLLDNRSDAAIELKHANISAILLELGFPYINGYKPYKNYQRLLFDIVEPRLNGASQLNAIAAQRATDPAEVPKVSDILSRLVEPPRVEGRREVAIADRPHPSHNVDYLALEARNLSLGAAGESFVFEFEQVRLSRAGQEKLAAQVQSISTTLGDAEGYDILSFEVSGRERLIEVMTTSYGDRTPFFVSPNEVATSANRPDQYYLYRVFGFRTDPNFFMVGGDITRSFLLTPVQFIARLA